MTNTHYLETELHSEFLAQGRIDPITGEEIEEGHTIVICSACKSAFFIESWEYLGQTHCNQAETLIEIPKPKNIFLKAKPLEYLPILFRKGTYFAKTGKEGRWEMWRFVGNILLITTGLFMSTFLIGYFISKILAAIVGFSLMVFISTRLGQKEELLYDVAPNPKKISYIAIDLKNQALQIKKQQKNQTLPFEVIEQLKYSIDYIYPHCLLSLEIIIPSISKKKMNYYTKINQDELDSWSSFLEELPYNLKVLQIMRNKDEL